MSPYPHLHSALQSIYVSVFQIINNTNDQPLLELLLLRFLQQAEEQGHVKSLEAAWGS